MVASGARRTRCGALQGAPKGTRSMASARELRQTLPMQMVGMLVRKVQGSMWVPHGVARAPRAQR
ncbi:hypothetical protein ASF43_24425 [Pseudorhodoferax sp. Leaf267]|nr:hypothetical protein ASF43_24425 [Pseudorhodoferax sp. Leaf267]